MTERVPLSRTVLTIVKAIHEIGYRVDSATGTVYGPNGAPLKPAFDKKSGYGRVRLYVPDGFARYQDIPVHKIVAWTIWGAGAFGPDVVIRHRDEDKTNCRSDNLVLVGRAAGHVG
jgi:hypothetical protein